jgi:alkanesulfonate monooxygenase SsuD/methylene tetrahydromethanopterin reductase-like flavin-dependent oxidoreductase (luciferase family)
VSHRAIIEGMLGLALVDPVSLMREYVTVVRGALGGEARFEGRYY